jgi:opacity protein-like surface antigen
MKKFVFCAFFALLAAPVAISAVASPQMELAGSQSRIYNVLLQAAEQLGESYDFLCNAYENGEVTVEKVGSVYRVADTGGSAIIFIEDNF